MWNIVDVPRFNWFIPCDRLGFPQKKNGKSNKPRTRHTLEILRVFDKTSFLIWSLHPSCLQRNFHFPIFARGFSSLSAATISNSSWSQFWAEFPIRQTSSILVDYIPFFVAKGLQFLLIKSSFCWQILLMFVVECSYGAELDTPKSSELQSHNSSVHFWHGLWASESSPQAKKTTNRGLSENGEYSPNDHSNFNGEYENGPLEFRVKTPKFQSNPFFGGRCLKPTLHHSANTRNKNHGEKIDLKESSKSPYFSISLLIFDPPKRLACGPSRSRPSDLQVNQAHVLFEVPWCHVVVDGPAVAILPRVPGSWIQAIKPGNGKSPITGGL